MFNFAVLHHVANWRDGLQEIARVLKVGGRLFSQDHDVANHDWLSRHLFEHPPDRFSNVEFLDQVTNVGLRPLDVEDRPWGSSWSLHSSADEFSNQYRVSPAAGSV